MKVQTYPLNLRINEDLDEEIKSLAAAMHVSKSELARRALEAGLKGQRRKFNKYLLDGLRKEQEEGRCTITHSI